jgi:hypothetical protein
MLPSAQRDPQYRPKTLAELQAAARAVPAPPPAAEVENSPPQTPQAPHRREVPEKYIRVEPKPLSAYDDNPVLNEDGAAFVVGVSADLLKKWRHRNQGPSYIQYGKDGPVRYELNELLEFRDSHKVYLTHRRGPKPRSTANA